MAGFCQTGQNSSAPPVWADPLGPSSLRPNGVAQYGASGAPQYRNQLFSSMGGMSPQLMLAGNELASGLRSAAGNSFWGNAGRLASGELAGNYLAGSPQLNTALAENESKQLSAAADENARTRSDMTRMGMSPSVATQQAEQSNTANAASNAASTNALAYLQNYQNERANQNAAPGLMSSAQMTPLNYLSQVTPALMNPLQQQGNMLSALSSGGQVITPNSSQYLTPSLGSNIMTGVGAASKLAGSLSGMGIGSGGMCGDGAVG